MAENVFIKDSHGTLLAIEAVDGIIQQSGNGTDFEDLAAGAVANAEHADTADVADLATLAVAATGPSDATVFTGTLAVATTGAKGLQSAADKLAEDDMYRVAFKRGANLGDA